MQLALRTLVLTFLAMSLFAGLSHVTVASNTMAVEMSTFDTAAKMVGMDCEQNDSRKPCDVSNARCTTGCFGPGVDLPRTWAVVRLADNTANARNIRVDALRTGINRPPGLPPPRMLDIA